MQMTNQVKQKAEKFIKEYKLYDVTYKNLKAAAMAMGYVVVEFNSHYNDEHVENLIDALKIKHYAETSRGFTYVDTDNRIIFVNQSLNDYEKLVVLSHEIGHVYLNHFNTGNIIGNDVIQEKDANEFSHYLLKKNLKMRIYSKIHKNKKVSIICAVTVLIIAVGTAGTGITKKQQSYYGQYYVTQTGNKFHKKDCIFVKNKTNIHRLTKEEFQEGKYQPCNTCLPE